MWLLVMYNEKEQAGLQEIQNTQFEEIKRNGIKGMVTSGQDPTQLILQLVKRFKVLSVSKDQEQIKAKRM